MVTFAGLHGPTRKGLQSKETHSSRKFPAKQEEDNWFCQFHLPAPLSAMS